MHDHTGGVCPTPVSTQNLLSSSVFAAGSPQFLQLLHVGVAVDLVDGLDAQLLCQRDDLRGITSCRSALLPLRPVTAEYVVLHISSRQLLYSWSISVWYTQRCMQNTMPFCFCWEKHGIHRACCPSLDGQSGTWRPSVLDAADCSIAASRPAAEVAPNLSLAHTLHGQD